jgi:acyl-CoA synthetase (AMP-forming)/AMP-acid ligase II
MMLLDMAVSSHSERVAIGGRGVGLTFGQLYERAGNEATKLRRDGIGHLAYMGTNSPAFAISVFAGAWAGIPVIPVNYRLGRDQVSHVLDQHADVLVVADAQAREILRGVRHPVVDRDEWMGTTADGAHGDSWPNDADGIAVLLYTSGTTSAPKAAILRHRHLLSYVFASVEFGGAGEADSVAVTVPPYHVAGVANLVSNLYAGRRLVYLDAFSPVAWLDTVRHEQVTNAMVVPTMLARIVESLEGRRSADVPSLRTLSYGGSRIAPSIVARALELFPTTDLVNAYGLTETSSTIALLGPEDHRAAVASDDPVVRSRLGSAGRLIPGVEAEIRGPDGRPVPAGETGELWLRGEQVSGEYMARESPLDADGWFPTRDRAWFDQEGYLFIEGRADDTIIRGGENIAPSEIEEVLVQFPAVADAAVVGVPDDEWGQRIAAVVVPAAGMDVDPEALRAFVREHLRSSKTPDQVEVRAELPYTDTGKLLRRVVLAELVGDDAG